MKSDNTGSILRALGLGAFIGVGAGLAMGLLMAPEEGSRLRRRISFHLEGVRRQLKDILESGLGEKPDNQARQHGQALVNEVQERAQEISNKIDDILGSVPGHDENH